MQTIECAVFTELLTNGSWPHPDELERAEDAAAALRVERTRDYVVARLQQAIESSTLGKER